MLEQLIQTINNWCPINQMWHFKYFYQCKNLYYYYNQRVILLLLINGHIKASSRYPWKNTVCKHCRYRTMRTMIGGWGGVVRRMLECLLFNFAAQIPLQVVIVSDWFLRWLWYLVTDIVPGINFMLVADAVCWSEESELKSRRRTSRVVPLPNFYNHLIEDIEALGWSWYVSFYYYLQSIDWYAVCVVLSK